MNPMLECIHRRRSIRQYQDRPVDRETMTELLKAAMAAPSACNEQPWEFVAVNEPDTMDRLRSKLYAGKYNAPAAIAVCGNMELAMPNAGSEYWVQDCSAAIQNILLAAIALGLGSVWIGVYPLPSVVKPVSEALSLPQHVIPLGVVYVGYPAEQKEPRNQYNEKAVYWEQYDSGRKHRARPKNLKKQ